MFVCVDWTNLLACFGALKNHKLIFCFTCSWPIQMRIHTHVIALFFAKIWLISLHLDLLLFFLYGCLDAQICGICETPSSLRLSYFFFYHIWVCESVWTHFTFKYTFCFSCLATIFMGWVLGVYEIISSRLFSWLYVAVLVWKIRYIL